MSRLSIHRCERESKPMRLLRQRFAAAVFVLSLAALGWLGREIYFTAPPIPEVARAESGETFFTGEQIRDGRQLRFRVGARRLRATGLAHAASRALRIADADAARFGRRARQQEIRANTFAAGLRRIAMESRP